MTTRSPRRPLSPALPRLPIFDPGLVASLADWRTISTGRHNVLIEGPPSETAAVLACLTPHLEAPVGWMVAGVAFVPPAHAGSLILQDVARLSGPAQVQLREWLASAPGMSLISTASEPLFRLVDEGRFDETLYYRLNVILLRLCCPDLSLR